MSPISQEEETTGDYTFMAQWYVWNVNVTRTLMASCTYCLTCGVDMEIDNCYTHHLKPYNANDPGS